MISPARTSGAGRLRPFKFSGPGLGPPPCGRLGKRRPAHWRPWGLLRDSEARASQAPACKWPRPPSTTCQSDSLLKPLSTGREFCYKRTLGCCKLLSILVQRNPKELPRRALHVKIARHNVLQSVVRKQRDQSLHALYCQRHMQWRSSLAHCHTRARANERMHVRTHARTDAPHTRARARTHTVSHSSLCLSRKI